MFPGRLVVGRGILDPVTVVRLHLWEPIYYWAVGANGSPTSLWNSPMLVRVQPAQPIYRGVR